MDFNPVLSVRSVPKDRLSSRRCPPTAFCPPSRVPRPQLGEEPHVTSACGRSRGEAAGVGSPEPGQMRACRVSTSTSSQQGHLTATCSSILLKRLPIPKKYGAGMTRSECVGRARRHAVAPAPCRLLYPALAKVLVSLPPSGSSGPRGRAVSGSWSNDALCAACRPLLTSLPNFCWTLLELVVTASCAPK